jgi:methenyltetrahydrofolate cyclohydrolase
MTDAPSNGYKALLDSIAAKTPTPGGGAVAAMTGQLAAALAAMVVNYSIGRKDLAAHDAALRSALDALSRERAEFGRLADEDARAYAVLNEAFKLPKDAPDRAAKLASASLAASLVPMEILRRASALVELCERLAPITNRNLRSDLGIAAVLAEAAARSAVWNIEINLPQVEPMERSRLKQESGRLLAASVEGTRRVEAACRA